MPLIGSVLFIAETIGIRAGWLAWSGTIHELSVWGGTRHQMPLTEVVIFGATCTAIAGLRFFRDDSGRSVVERGVDTVRSARRRAVVGTLALVGFANMAMIAYNVFTVPLALYMGPTPTGYPSYMRNGVCGADTPYECPGPDVPIILPNGRPR